MQEYSRIGSDILGQHNDDLLSAAAIVALQHHEKWNGKGYPKGLSKNDIHIYARTCAIADVFDAWEVDKAINLIKEEKGNHFDPLVVNAFFNALDGILEIQNKF